MKAFLGLIINMDVIALPNKSLLVWWVDNTKLFGVVMSSIAFYKYFEWCMWETIPLKKAVGPSEEQRNYMGW
jgi:hypothetical protein